MRRISGMKSVVFLYIVFAFLMGGSILASAVYVTHIITIIRSDGEVSPSNWPQQYAEGFQQYISVKNDVLEIGADGIASLEGNQLWAQIIDDQGNQVTEYEKPTDAPSRYSISNLLDMEKNGEFKDYTVSIFSLSVDGENYECIIGFPIKITKKTLYFNSERYSDIKTVVFSAFAGVGVTVVIAGFLYGAWLTKHVSRITQSSSEIAARTYKIKQEKGVFSDAYKSLNELDAEIRISDEKRAETERMQEDWITNITHDLKTPLSPIRGYAELLVDSNDSLPHEILIRYGNTILRNTDYAEKLINDLKMTYQLKNNIFPISMKRASLTRFLKEVIIEILNHPKYSCRNITFTEANEEVIFCFDELLLKRAVNNLIYNALLHNGENTEVHVALCVEKYITCSVEDNGNGMSDVEKERLFERYYRGTNMEKGTEGTGLGMAIAKEIIEIHGGNISVSSEVKKGTRITVNFPREN